MNLDRLIVFEHLFVCASMFTSWGILEVLIRQWQNLTVKINKMWYHVVPILTWLKILRIETIF